MSGLVPAIYNGVRKLTTLTQAIYDSVSGGGGGDGTVTFDAPVVGTPPRVGDIVPFDGVSVSARRGRLVETISSTDAYAPITENAVVAITSVLGGLTFVVAPTSNNKDTQRVDLTARLYNANGARVAAANTSYFTGSASSSVSVCEHVVLSDNGVTAVVACFVWWYSFSASTAYLGVAKYTITATAITVNFTKDTLLAVGSGASVSARNSTRFIAESASSVLLLGAATNAASTSMPTRRITLTTSASITAVASPTFSSIDYASCAATVHTVEGGAVILLSARGVASSALLVTVSGGVATAVTPLTITVDGAELSSCSWLRPQRGRYAGRVPTTYIDYAPVGYLAGNRPAPEITGNPAKNEWVLAYAATSDYGTPAPVLFTLEGTTLVGTVNPDLVFCADGAYRDANAQELACVPYDRTCQFSIAVNGFAVLQFVQGAYYSGGSYTSYWLSRAPVKRVVPVEIVSVSGGIATVRAAIGSGIGHVRNPDGVPIRAPSYKKGSLLRTVDVYPRGGEVTLTTRTPVFVEVWRVVGATASVDSAFYAQVVDGVHGGWAQLSAGALQYAKDLLGEALVLSDYLFASSSDSVAANQTIKMFVYAAEVEQ